MRNIGRKIFYGIAIILIAAGVYFLITAWNYQQDFYRWQDARPVDMTIDMSAPGEFKSSFLQTCHISHGEAICLLLPSDCMDANTWPKQLAELKLVCRILDRNGNEIIREEFNGESLSQESLIEGSIPLVRFVPFKDGDYTMMVTVTKGSATLRGVPQRIIGRYMLCGLELMAAFLSMIIGIAALIIAALIAGITFMVVRGKAKKAIDQQKKDQC